MSPSCDYDVITLAHLRSFPFSHPQVERRQLPTAGQTVADSTAYQTQPGMTYPSASVYVVMPNMDLGFGVVPTPPRDNVPSGKGPNDAVVAMINAATQVCLCVCVSG